MTEIIQADRDAAAEHIPAIGMANSVLNGKSDNHTLVRAFARHRMEERAAIVAWLRETADIFKQEIVASKKRDTSEYLHHQQSCMRAADAIEEGEHLL